MKIDSSLRAVIRAAHAAQVPQTWRQKVDAITEAAKELLESKPKLKKAFELAQAKNKESEQLAREALSILPDIGIGFNFYIREESKFEAAGGKLPEEKQRWTYDEVATELAACDPKDAPVILLKYGINWK